MSPTKQSYNNFIGIDIAKNTFVAYLYNDKKTYSFSNNEGGINDFIKHYEPFFKDGLVVLEHTGGYERKVLDALFHKGFNVCCVHSPLIKAFIKSYGIKAKTDGVDAKGITLYGKERGHTLETIGKWGVFKLLKKKPPFLDSFLGTILQTICVDRCLTF